MGKSGDEDDIRDRQNDQHHEIEKDERIGWKKKGHQENARGQWRGENPVSRNDYK